MSANPRHDFKSAAARAVADAKLRKTMRRVNNFLRGLRAKGFDDFPEFEAFRARAKDAKERAVTGLPELLARFEENCRAVGGHVHYAADAAEACRLVVEIALARGAGRVVKGKSMATEEIGLNEALEGAGLTVFETDLGEYIVQLAGEKPSHILSPALHKSRYDVADLFEEKLGRSCDGENIAELCRIARETLRQEFLAADMGVTGANMLIAETGTVVLLENEGNIRMSTTCPGLHVAVAGLEKIVADLEDMAAVLDLLPRSATSQRMPGYLNLYTGPRKPGEPDGPDELHVIILDNGRSRLLADPVLRQSLRCVRCSACLNVCPVYMSVGGHAYGGTYPGPIGSILTPGLSGGAEGADLPHACTQCGACAAVCPVGIDHPRVLLRLRELYPGALNRSEGLAASAHAHLAGHPGLYRTASAALRAVDPDLTKVFGLPGMKRAARWGKMRVLPRLTRPFSKRWKRLAMELAEKGGKTRGK